MRHKQAPGIRAGLLIAMAFALAMAAVWADEGHEAIEQYKRGIRNQNPVERASVTFALKYADNSEAAKLALQSCLDKHILVRTAALQAMEGFCSSEAVQTLVDEGLTHFQPQIRAIAAKAMATLQAEEAVAPLIQLVSDSAQPDRVVGPAAYALGRIEAEEALEPLLGLGKHESAMVRAEAALALAQLELGLLDDPRPLEVLLRLLYDEVWQVRISAVEALAATRNKRGVGALIERLALENGRLREDIAEALRDLTGKSGFGVEVEQWGVWWDANEGEYPDQKMPPAAASGDHGAEPGETGVIEYHALRTYSKKFMFLVDISDSMNDRMNFPLEEEETRELEEDEQGRVRKIDVAKAELKKVIEKLAPDVSFNIILYAHKVKAWKKTIVPATRSNIRRALRFVDKITVFEEGATDIYQVLMEALDMAEQGLRRRQYESMVDTVFFLTDGRPTRGETTKPDDILRVVLERNRVHKLKLHTIGFGKSSERYLLEKLAEQNRGRFQYIEERS